MVDRRLGFGPQAKPDVHDNGELVVANPRRLEEFKGFLKDALEQARKRDGSASKDCEIDLINQLLSQIGMVEDVGKLLGIDFSSELVVPGSDEFKKTKKKRKLGFEVPEPDGSSVTKKAP